MNGGLARAMFMREYGISWSPPTQGNAPSSPSWPKVNITQQSHRTMPEWHSTSDGVGPGGLQQALCLALKRGLAGWRACWFGLPRRNAEETLTCARPKQGGLGRSSTVRNVPSGAALAAPGHPNFPWPCIGPALDRPVGRPLALCQQAKTQENATSRRRACVIAGFDGARNAAWLVKRGLMESGAFGPTAGRGGSQLETALCGGTGHWRDSLVVRHACSACDDPIPSFCEIDSASRGGPRSAVLR